MRPTEQVGDVLGLGAGGVEGVHLDPAVAHRGRRAAVETGTPRVGGDAPRDADGGGDGWDAVSSRGPKRRVVRSATTGAGSPVVAGKADGEVEDAVDVGPAEAVDRLVGVADHDEVASVARQRLEEGDLAGVGVLVLVDEDVAVAGAQLVAVVARRR